MHIVHGTWIPAPPGEFVQTGGFYLWVETDTPIRQPRRPGAGVHPRHLANAALDTFVAEGLGVRAFPLAGPARRTRAFLLPSAAGAPLPSVELLPYLETTTPAGFDLMWWKICCYRVPDVISTLNELHFAALHAAEDFQLGADLLFWYQYTQVLRAIIRKDEYIPALKYRLLPPASGKRGQPADRFELHPAWELVSDTYEAAVQDYVAAMPAVCAAGSTTPSDSELWAREPLLRHFSECLLHDMVTATPFTAKFDQQIAGSLLYACVYPYRPASLDRTAAEHLDTYRQWAAWRQTLTIAHTAARFTLCFRLDEAPASDVDAWQLHFLVASKADPSFKLSLANYWQLGRAARADVLCRFGQDFDKQLLLALGHAARIYPRLWAGLETAQPVGFRLTLDEAFAFLKDSAWVLEDAGYTVMVPAWWTPEGRRRVKVRLRTAARPSKQGPAAQPGGYFSLDTVVDYQYQLSIGGQVVTEAEWQQLVAAKPPLVHFRGQWMGLARDRMQQLLAFWQTRRDAAGD